VDSIQQKQTSPARTLAVVAMVGALLALAIVSMPGSPSLARQDGQDAAVATPGTPVAVDFTRPVAERPAQIQAGECGSDAEPLAVLTPLEKPEGEAEGQPNAIEAERSYTSIPLTLEALLTGQTNVTVLFDSADDAVVIACGEIGGVPSEGGSLVVKLSEQNGSGYSGIAFLSPEDTASTGASIFLAGQLNVSETRALAAVATPAADLTPLPEPTPTAEPVQVADIVLLEWMIDMPAEIRAGTARLVITNEGTEAHSMVVEGQGLIFELPAPLAPGESTILSADLPPGDYLVYCPQNDGEHRAEGMEATLSVVP
jgi:hypothetical protein